MRPTKSHSVLTRCAKATSRAAGRPWTFVIACGLIVVWLISGPYFHYSDTWQLVINTSTTIITFLMVFLIQSTQNRDAEALQEHELDQVRTRYTRLAEQARGRLRSGKPDTDAPEADPGDAR